MSLMPTMETDEQEEQNQCAKKYYGKYRGIVVQNIDPMQLGRIMAIVPDVSNLIPTTWATPCLPSAGIQQGTFTVPTIGSGVWIEFEQGDPDYPIWVGGYWGSAAEVPAMALAAPPAAPPVVIQSLAQNRIIISSTPGEGIRLETIAGPAGPSIILTATGIILKDAVGGMIAITGGTVSINKTNLVVLP
jgi:hypothetical protein